MQYQPATREGRSKTQSETLRHARPATSLSVTHKFHAIQQALGNQAFGQFLQAKLTVSQPGDEFEEEADRMADQDMRMADPTSNHLAISEHPAAGSIQRACSKCEEEDEDKNKVQRKAVADSELTKPRKQGSGTSQQTPPVETQIDNLRNGGEPLSESIRNHFELRFEHDFSRVRIHADGEAANAAHAVSARAYTLGRDIVFAAGEYAPTTPEGGRLLAHELTHVVQQGEARRTEGTPEVRPGQRTGTRANESLATPATTSRTSPLHIQRQSSSSYEKPSWSDEADFLLCWLTTPPPLLPRCFLQRPSVKKGKQDDTEAAKSGGGSTESWTPAPAPHATPRSPDVPPPTLEPFFHGSTWRIAQQIPGNVKPIGGGDFGQGFYTHHEADENKAAERARWEGCRLCQKMSPPERYAGVIRFDVSSTEYKSLFRSRKTFGLTTTTQKDYAARQKKWLDFVSGRGRGREPDPTFEAAHMSWRHQRVNPPPDQDYFLIEGPMYKGVEGLPGSSLPPRSAFDPYAEGTALPQQVVWNHEGALAVLNKSKASLKQFDAKNKCVPVDPPASVTPLTASVAEDPKALEAAQIELTGR